VKHLPLVVVILVMTSFFNSCASTSKVDFHESAYIPEDFAGIVHAGQSRTKKEFEYANYAGAKWTLHTIPWNTVEPEQGEWDFLVYDALVDKANASGIKIIGLLAYDNWRLHEDRDLHNYIPPQHIPDFLHYVKRTVEHFKGRIDAWCIWNEPNFGFWKGTEEEFIELTRLTADAIREIDSEVIVLGGAFNRNVLGLPEKLIRGLFESGAMDKVDAVAFHPYDLNPARSAVLFQKFKKIVGDYGFADKIWVTEVGYPTGGWYPMKVREKNFPGHVIKTCILLASCGSKKILWYQLSDPVKREKKSSLHFYGLVRSRRDYTSKGAEAFRLCAIHLAGTVYRPDLPTREKLPSSLRAFYFERPTGGGTLVLWKEGASTKITLQPPVGSAIHDPASGSSAAISAETTLTVGSMPIFITWTGSGSFGIIGNRR